MRHTRAQRAAAKGAGPISAGAGCGRTEALALRVCRLLKREDPCEIAVIASDTVGRKLRERLASTDLDRAALDLVQIGTLHSLCRRAVRERALELGVEPGFTVLGFAEAEALAEKVLDELSETEPFALLARELGDEELREALLAVRSEAVPEPAPAPFLAAFERCAGEVLALPREDLEERLGEIEAGWEKAHATALRLVERFDWGDHARLKRYRSRFAVRRISPEIDHAFAVARGALTAFLAACLDAPSAELARRLLDLSAQFRAAYSAEKERAGALDADDLLACARKLPRRYKFVLLDQPDETALEIGGRLAENLFVTHVPGPDLRENFASSPEIVRFANRLFGEVWREEPEEYAEMRPARRAPGCPVELVVVPRSTDESPYGWDAEEGRKNEARAVALRVRELLEEGVPPGDVAVLVHSAAGSGVFLDALSGCGVPVENLCGEGLAEREEVRDALLLLRAAKDPDDLEVLTTRLVGLSPEVAERVASLRALDVTPFDAYSDYERLSALRDLLAEIAGMSPADALETAFAALRYEERLLALPDGLTRWETVRRFREFVRAVAPASLAELEERLRGVRFSGVERGGVRVTTVRRAAGRRFPVVILTDMSRSFRDHPDSFLAGERLAVRVRNPRTGLLETPLSYMESAERAAERRAVEEKRFFYSALTRADERLILVGASELRRDRRSTYRETSSWIGWLEKALDLGPETEPGRIEPGVIYRTELSAPPPKEPTLIELHPREFREGRPIPGVAPMAFVRELPPAGVRRLSVSRVLDYLECPKRFASVRPVEPAESEGISASAFGQIVHDLLSEMDFADPQVGALVEKVDPALREEARRLLESVAGSPHAAEMRESEELLAEVPFELAFDGTVLAGRFDVLYKRGGWAVLDYKTGRAEDRERYALQVGIYAHAVERLLGERCARAVLLFLSVDDEWSCDTSDGRLAREAEEAVRSAISGIARGEFGPAPGAHCKWCSQRGECR
ncbi:MAG: UvrD-helicase domain-containing protein [Armatimonadota bacterium]